MPANEFLQMLGLAGEPPEVNAIPDAAAVPDDWRRLRKGLPSAVAS